MESDAREHVLARNTRGEWPLANLRIPSVGCYIGTTRRNWRTMTTFQNSYTDLLIISRHGRNTLGSDGRISEPTEDEIRSEQLKTWGGMTAAIHLEHPPDNASFSSGAILPTLRLPL